MLTPVLSAKAAAAAIAVLSISGAAAATYSGALPATLQQFAHNVAGAPAARHHQQVTAPRRAHGAPATGPSATGHAAYGLCTAYQHALAHGRAAQKSVAFRNLVKTAGGASHVTQYCAGIRHPGPRHHKHAPTRHWTKHRHPHPRPAGAPTQAA